MGCSLKAVRAGWSPRPLSALLCVSRIAKERVRPQFARPMNPTPEQIRDARVCVEALGGRFELVSIELQVPVSRLALNDLISLFACIVDHAYGVHDTRGRYCIDSGAVSVVKSAIELLEKLGFVTIDSSVHRQVFATPTKLLERAWDDHDVLQDVDMNLLRSNRVSVPSDNADSVSYDACCAAISDQPILGVHRRERTQE